MVDQDKVARLDCGVVGRRRRPVRPARGSREINWVERAIKAIPGGAPRAAKLCGVTKQAVYDWMGAWRIERLVDALKVSRASGIAIEKFAGPKLDLTEAIQLGEEVEKSERDAREMGVANFRGR